MMDKLLPEEVTVDILSRLPAESVLECKLVCKTWESLIRHPSFAHMHLRQQLHQNTAGAGKEGFLFESREKIHYGHFEDDDHDDDDDQSKMVLTRTKINPPSSMGWIVGTCNGLICFSVFQYFGDPIFICNPITREYVNLPKFNITNEENPSTSEDVNIPKSNINMIGAKPLKVYNVSSGFGYSFSTNEYKVVRISCSYLGKNLSPLGYVEVYTLGSSSGWRNIGEITYMLGGDNWYYKIGTLANGALHWVEKKGRILAFDLADESFRLLPSPPCFPPGDFPFCGHKTFRLGVFRGWFSVSYDDGIGKTEVWSFKEEENSRDYVWSRELSIKMAFMDDFGYDLPNVILTKRGEVLFYNSKRLYRYESNTATMENSVDFNDYVYQVVPNHMNSFVSLKDLGEEDTKTI